MAKGVTQVNNSSQQRATSEPPDRPTGPLAIPMPAGERDVVKVNNANLSELKNACDDALKRVRPPIPLPLFLLHSGVTN